MSDVTRSGQAPVGLTRAEQKQEWSAAPPPDHEKLVDPNTPKCAACGRHHTVPGITHESAERNCLVATVKRQREEIAALKAEIATLKTVRRIEHGDDPAKPGTECEPSTDTGSVK